MKKGEGEESGGERSMRENRERDQEVEETRGRCGSNIHIDITKCGCMFMPTYCH